VEVDIDEIVVLGIVVVEVDVIVVAVGVIPKPVSLLKRVSAVVLDAFAFASLPTGFTTAVEGEVDRAGPCSCLTTVFNLGSDDCTAGLLPSNALFAAATIPVPPVSI